MSNYPKKNPATLKDAELLDEFTATLQDVLQERDARLITEIERVVSAVTGGALTIEGISFLQKRLQEEVSPQIVAYYLMLKDEILSRMRGKN